MYVIVTALYHHPFHPYVAHLQQHNEISKIVTIKPGTCLTFKDLPDF